jgi:hypothetical protein
MRACWVEAVSLHATCNENKDKDGLTAGRLLPWMPQPKVHALPQLRVANRSVWCDFCYETAANMRELGWLTYGSVTRCNPIS